MNVSWRRRVAGGVIIPFSALLGLFIGGCTHVRSRAPHEIHSVAELRKLDLAALRAQVPVRIRGYITLSDASWNVMILQDEAGNGVRLESNDFTVPVYQLVEVTGIASAGGNTPSISNPQIKWLSLQPPPEPRSSSLADLTSKAGQYTRVTTEGVIAAITPDRNDRVSGLMRSGNNVIGVRIFNASPAKMNALVNSTV